MRIYSIVSAAVSGVLMAGVSTVAFAGSHANGSSYNPALAPYEGVPSAVCRARLEANSLVSTCTVRSVVHAAAADPLAPINYYNSTPYGHLKTFAYKNTPNVNIMRVDARAPMAALNYVPIRFAGGCNTVAPSSCGRNAVIAAPAPVVPAPMPAPVYQPVMRPAPLPVMQPAPLSFVRPPVFQPAPVLPVAPTVPVQFQTSNTMITGNTMRGNAMGGNVIGHVSGGSYTYTKPGTPDYWEKTSGATVISGMPATQVVCRRAGTAATSQTVNVVRPVIGVPTPVPTPLPYCLPGQNPLAPIAMPMANNRWAQ